MADDANPDGEAPEAKLRAYGDALADAVEAAVPGWVVRSVLDRLGPATSGHVRAEARAAGERARQEVVPRLRQLLATDIDAQGVNPLMILRAAVRYPTDVLRAAGAPPAERDEFQERAFPDDVYDLVPTSFADVDPDLHEPGLVWGAAKAYVHLARRRSEEERA